MGRVWGDGEGTDEPAGGVDACVARPDAREPLGHAELEEALFRVHGDGWEAGARGWCSVESVGGLEEMGRFETGGRSSRWLG